MLELLSGNRPIEVFRPKMSREIVAWVHQMRREEKPEEVSKRCAQLPKRHRAQTKARQKKKQRVI
ncbi:hypothetical protein Bca4012_057675 [Brassica carinata]